ncbi:MAG: polysaccharide pyruvyl transferase family protein [Clostridia bacterium]|nr:polysaccharide pyruvyl transferase family protein [Clostridia bacterium]
MKIKTITCHDVYNVGASLQAYALQTYLAQQGHDVEIIDYKPSYLSRHYSLTAVNNPRYDRPLIREAYLLAKLPGRLRALCSARKRSFDRFREEMLHVTSKRYTSSEEMKRDLPEADVYIAGSDQIWNPLFPNGKDPAFFLAFVPEEKKKISYAASFAVDELEQVDSERMMPWIKRLDAVSVRERSGVALLAQMGVGGVQVCDPVFLLSQEQWSSLIAPQESGILVYDFDASEQVCRMAEALASERHAQIVSVFPMKNADRVCSGMGPREFLGAISSADMVLSNSFHATAFSLIFHKEFFVVERREKINTRMRDLLAGVGLEDRLVRTAEDMDAAASIDWADVDVRLRFIIAKSYRWLNEQLR